MDDCKGLPLPEDNNLPFLLISSVSQVVKILGVQTGEKCRRVADGVDGVRRPPKFDFHQYEQASESPAATSRVAIDSGRLFYQQGDFSRDSVAMDSPDLLNCTVKQEHFFKPISSNARVCRSSN